MDRLQELITRAEAKLGALILNAEIDGLRATGEFLYDGCSCHYGAAINNDQTRGILMLHEGGTYLPLVVMRFERNNVIIDTINEPPIEIARLIATSIKKAGERAQNAGAAEPLETLRASEAWAELLKMPISPELVEGNLKIKIDGEELMIFQRGRCVARYNGAVRSSAGRLFATT